MRRAKLYLSHSYLCCSSRKASSPSLRFLLSGSGQYGISGNSSSDDIIWNTYSLFRWLWKAIEQVYKLSNSNSMSLNIFTLKSSLVLAAESHQEACTKSNLDTVRIWYETYLGTVLRHALRRCDKFLGLKVHCRLVLAARWMGVHCRLVLATLWWCECI